MPTSLPVLPRASSRINDNDCYNRPQGPLLARSTSTEQTLNSNLNVNFHVVTPVPSAPGPPQKKGISPGMSDCHLRRGLLNSVKGVSCVTQLSCVNPVTNVKNAAQNLAVGTRLQNFWQTWLDLGAGLKVVQILREGYTLPLRTRPRLARFPTIVSCYVNPHRNSYLLEALHQLYREKCRRTGKASNFSRVFQSTISSSKTQQQVEAHTRSEQTESFPQDGEIQNGDTRNHQNVPPTRGMGHLNRL